MATIKNLEENSKQITQHNSPQLLPELKIQEEQTYRNQQFQDASRVQLLSAQTNQTDSVQNVVKIQHFNPNPIQSIDSSPVPQKPNNHSSSVANQIVEENASKQISNFQPQINQFMSSNWFLPRHPNSLFKTIQPNQKNQIKKQSKILFPSILSQYQKTYPINRQVQNKLAQIKNEEKEKIPKVEFKTKHIQKSTNFKPRKGKNQQPIAQKMIKKLSGFHYNKNYKQNRNKTLKKLAKRSLAINQQNFTTFIGRLKLQINKKFTKTDRKSKKNVKGKQIDPKKSYDLYHSHFPFIIQRQFVERFYNQVFKRVYVIMWKSDERLKRVDSIKIQGVNYNTIETDPSAEVKIQHKEMESEKQPITESKPEEKRAAFVQCLDEEGKKELDDVFEEDYEKLYDGFEWSTSEQDFIVPQKQNLRKRIQKFAWIED